MYHGSTSVMSMTEFDIHVNFFYQLTSKDGVVISKDGCTHKLIIQNCKDSDAGQYHFEVNGCKTEAMVKVGGNYNSNFFFTFG